jgi:hypothetical protein
MAADNDLEIDISSFKPSLPVACSATRAAFAVLLSTDWD